jgi:hypothetical protein
LHLQKLAGGSDSPEPEAAVAVVCGDGVAGELERGRNRASDYVWEVEVREASSGVCSGRILIT